MADLLRAERKESPAAVTAPDGQRGHYRAPADPEATEQREQTNMAEAYYGWSRGKFWYRSPSGMQHAFQTLERFRYALRNEFRLPNGLVEQITAECELAKRNATRCDCGGTVAHERTLRGGYACPVAFHNDGGNV